MDLNSVLLQVPSPTAASSSEEAAPRSQTGKNPSTGGTKKSFASVLRTVHQGEYKGRLDQSNDADCRQVTKPGSETEQGKGAGDDTPRSGKTEGRNVDAETEQLSQNHTDQSDDQESPSQDVRALEANVPVELVRVSGQVIPPQGEPVMSSFLSAEESGRSPMEEALLHPSQDNDVAGVLAVPMAVMGVRGESATATTEEIDQATVLSQGDTVPMGTPSQTASAPQPIQEIIELPAGQRLHPIAEPVSKAVDQKAGEHRETSAQENHRENQATPVQLMAEGGKLVSPVSQELSRLDTAGPHLDRVVERSVGQKQVEGAVQSHAEPRLQFFSHDGDERTEKPVAMAPYNPETFSGAGEPSDTLWSNGDDRQPASQETPWPPHPLTAPSQPDLSGARSAQSATVGNAVPPQSQPVDSRPASPAGATPSVSAAHEVEPFMPMMSRSVAFEIAEPDLGRIHIRVAMTNELVHTHLSSDRSDVGQLLFSGQDRLQSALQSNGLEMGQFRVDIDRQSAGRSFQQGSSQDQSRMWQQASNGAPQEDGFFDRHAEARLSYAGRLDLVA